MGRYLDLLRDPGDHGNLQSSHYDKNDRNDQSHADVERGSKTRAIRGVRSFMSFMSYSNSSDVRSVTGEPSDLAFWREVFEERAAVRQFDGGYSRAQAERLAWGELQNRWHLAHGERVPRELCAGCRRPIGDAAALDLIDGNRVHHAAGHDCLIAYGTRWRGPATAALVAIGLRPPVG
jgi:hypothetical protein